MNKFNGIFPDLEQKILAKERPPRSSLPSESQLAKIYGVSRETTKEAPNLLTTEGYIQKKQGEGSIVPGRNRFDFPTSGLTSYKELQETQRTPNGAIIHTLEETEVTKALNEITGWEIGAPVQHLIRERKTNGEVAVLDADYLLKEIVSILTSAQAQGLIYEYFENELSLMIAYTQKEVTVEEVTEVMKIVTSLYDDTYAVVVRSLVYLEDTRCSEYSESVHRLDKFRFVEFARHRRV